MELIIQHELICNKLIEVFCKKQDIEFDFWIGDKVNGIASFIHQYFFSLNDIVLDLKTNQRKGLILQWQNDCVDAHLRGNEPYINYQTYINLKKKK